MLLPRSLRKTRHPSTNSMKTSLAPHSESWSNSDLHLADAACLGHLTATMVSFLGYNKLDMVIIITPALYFLHVLLNCLSSPFAMHSNVFFHSTKGRVVLFASLWCLPSATASMYFSVFQLQVPIVFSM